MKFTARIIAISALATALLGIGAEMALAGTASTVPTPSTTASSNDNSWQNPPNPTPPAPALMPQATPQH